MLFSQFKHELFDGATNFLERHSWRDTDIQEDIGAVRCAAHPPRKSGAYAANVYYPGLAIVGGFFLPRGNPGVNRIQNGLHAKDRAVILLPSRKSSVDVVAARGETHPYRSVMPKHKLQIRGLAENAHIR